MESVRRTRLAWEEYGVPVAHRIFESPLWTAITAVFVYLFGPWHNWIGILITLVVIDFTSGWFVGGATGTTDSSLAWRGIKKKLSYGLALALAHQFDMFTGAGDVWGKTVLSLLIVTEFWSILENLDDLGVPMPPGIKDKLKALRSNNPRKRDRKEQNENQRQDQRTTKQG